MRFKKCRNHCLTLTFLCVVWLGSKEKQAYLQERFPLLSADAFANSRDTSFEQHVLLHTKGKGQTPLSVVEIVLDIPYFPQLNIDSL